METRSARRRRLSAHGGVGGGRDRIGELYDDLVLQILGRLRCAAAAARASTLSRRWRGSGLWRHLPELSFRGIAHGAIESALAQVALLKLSLLDIEITDRLPAEAVASMLRAAARLDPMEVSIVVAWVVQTDEMVPIEVPSFPRATSITLRLHKLHLALPAQGGEFPALERLSITSGRFDTGALISRCPHLRVLELIHCWGIETIMVHSATIEELLVISGQLRGVDVVVPMLKKFTLRSDVSMDFGMSLLAHEVENLSWKCWSHGQFLLPERNLQEMFPFPKISVLELSVDTRGHVYGGVVLNLLRICNAIQRLKLVIDRDMLRLRCAAAAARTSVLSRRWRGLWRHLPEISFSNIAPDALQAALAQVAIPKLSLLDIDFHFLSHHTFSAEGVASLLRTAARLDPVDLSSVAMVDWTDEPIAVEVPSFARATSIRLSVPNLHLTPPAQGGDFPMLEKLSIASRFDIGHLISRCPYLRVLEVDFYRGLDPITVHSATIEELLVTGEEPLRALDIVAPVLKKFTLRRYVHKDFSMSLLAPTVENLSWNCLFGFFCPEKVVIDASGMWRLKDLRICTATQKLKLFVGVGRGETVEACPPDCPCNQPQNWTSQNISLSLEEVEIENFKGSGREVDFLKLLFRCAPLMNVTLKLDSKVLPSSRGCKETYKIFNANPAAECHVYRKRGKEVIYA
ncbi:putative FBD-associated F-box protein [Panicum miliaceum]|uniref:FBD-associated F-box protein n=1 Tax=Panicum miliaceum TaxID=4540 RepID=A0A3L6T5S0_PANMI|nr:putative FBD-associated F-box protein [Panicum miliaceum]